MLKLELEQLYSILLKNFKSVDETPENAAAAIIELANQPDLWSKCSLAARALVIDQYSEEVCYQRWLHVITELCNRSTVTYPIPLPRKIVLPTIYPELLEGDRHKPPLFNRIFSSIKAKFRYKLSSVIKPIFNQS